MSKRNYKRLRPTWRMMLHMATRGRFVVGEANGQLFASDGFWLLVNVKVPESFATTTLDTPPACVTEPLASLEDCLLATLHLVVPEGKRFDHRNDDWIVLRTATHDAVFNAYQARWVEHQCGPGDWWVPAEGPARYVVDDQIVALLMPYSPPWYSKADRGLAWDLETRRYELVE